MSDNGEYGLEPVYATLHFYYNDPDSMYRMRECLNAPAVRSLLFEFDQWLRGQIKHHDRDDADGLQAARDKLWEIAGEHGIEIWED